MATNKLIGFAMKDLLNKRATSGFIGLELEMEGKNFPKSSLPSGWSYHEDHSLRGEDNAEYVLTKPIHFDKVDEYLNKLWSHMSDYNVRIDSSNRTSVHVHMNVQSWYMDRLASFFALYIATEELLTEWCGDHRVGNLFCLRTKDAPGILSSMKKFIQTNGEWRFESGMHYAGLNISALQKFGSLEVRTMRGALSPSEVSEWVRILRRLYDCADSYKDPRSVVDAFSASGPIAFLENLFGPEYSTLVSGIGWSAEKIKDALYEGIRMAQELIYCVDWDSFERVEIRPDPFGRNSATMVNKIKRHIQQEGMAAASPTLAFNFVQSVQFEDMPDDFFSEDEDMDYEPEEEYEDDF